jgi:hypothetical protein
MVVDPTATPVTTPVELTVALLVSEEVHVLLEVTSKAAPPAGVAVSLKVIVPPTFTAWLDQVNVKTRAVTVRLVFPLILTPSAFVNVALIEVVPGATVVTTPLVASILAIVGWDETQVTGEVLGMGTVVPSEYAPVAE